MKNLTATIFGTVPDEALFRWLSPEEFIALSRPEKDAYLYAVFAHVVRKPNPKSGEQQDPLGQN
jgi:hypothetical protein